MAATASTGAGVIAEALIATVGATVTAVAARTAGDRSSEPRITTGATRDATDEAGAGVIVTLPPPPPDATGSAPRGASPIAPWPSMRQPPYAATCAPVLSTVEAFFSRSPMLPLSVALVRG